MTETLTTPDTRKRGRPPKDPAAQLPPLDPTQEIHVVLYRAGSNDRAEVLDSADAAAARAQELATSRGNTVFTFGPPTGAYSVAAVNLLARH